MQENDVYISPYCKICGSCGEEMCCSYSCDNHIDGEYCRGYFWDYKFGYMMYKDILKILEENISKDNAIYEMIDKKWHENYEIIYPNR